MGKSGKNKATTMRIQGIEITNYKHLLGTYYELNIHFGSSVHGHELLMANREI